MASTRLPATLDLNHVNTTVLNFSLSCPQISSAVKMHDLYFCDTCEANQLPWYNSSADNNGPSAEYHNWWANGPPPRWISFWRAILETYPGLTDQPSVLSDQNVALWANSTAAFDFFWDPEVYSHNATWYADDLALWGGCVGNKTLKKQDASENANNNYDFNDMIEDCMQIYCCQIPLDSDLLSESNTPYPYLSNWNTADTCVFHTCQAATQGNPDLAGIGIIVAYYLEVSLLAGTFLMATLELFTASARAWHLKLPPHKDPTMISQLWKRHNAAFLCSSTVFLDAAIYFSLSVSFAGVWFNYRDKPLLYEDKLSQTSSLLAINTPVAVLLLIYRRPNFERPQLRYTLVAIASLMALIIQFLFRRTGHLDETSALCIVWNDTLNRPFDDRFILKAVWAGLVVIFFGSHLLPKVFPKWADKIEEAVKRYGQKARRSSSGILAPSRFKRLIFLICILSRKIIAILLAAYGIFDSYYDILFIERLRDLQRDVAAQAQYSSDDAEDTWGYGQILAILIWAPIFVEYFYIIIKGDEDAEEKDGELLIPEEEEMEYVGVAANEHHDVGP